MKRFKNILVVHSDHTGSDDALSRATDLATSNAASLTIMDVVQDAVSTPMVLAERQKRLSRLLISVQQEGVDATVIVVSGIPFLEIIRQVLHKDHDLVIMAADSTYDLRHIFFGSTSMHLMRKCPCPVWVLKPHQPRQYRKILAAVAYPVSETEHDELNIKILDLATSLAHTEDSELHILHAWDFTGADADTIRSEIHDETRGRLFHKYQSTHTTWIDNLLARYDLKEIQHHVHLVRGRPESTITQMVDENDINLIVMGTISQTGIPGFFIGNTAEYVLTQVNCSVLTLKPAGFVTPITMDL